MQSKQDDILAPLVPKRLYQRGQITIFFAISMVLIVTLITFVINVGLFVKAKINLQNATDAAAWSGAATQARQLTDIAYLNWEMRNVYKQWMFKYYVLGNLSAQGVAQPGKAGNSNNVAPGSMDFTLGPVKNSADRFNVPSICIHNRSDVSANDICSVYAIPGLPVLTFGFTSIDQTTTALTQALASEKARDCSERSKANFNIALQWIYGTGASENDKKILANAPHIAINYVGAWVKATEIAHRMRNLEYIVNTPPNKEGVCSDGAEDNCSIAVKDLEDQNFAGNERVIKAFASAYRNLGNDDKGQEIKQSFVLTEISPQPVIDNNASSLSNLFIPAPYEKHYLDLKLMPINFATFFSILNSIQKKKTDSSAAQEGACEMIKMAIPVPGYPFGFVKNPQVLTYYAVKGEAKFTGLFNPFGKAIKLTAFAAAKPFGGRIGPHIFNTYSDSSSVFARSEVGKFRSFPYVMGLELSPSLIPTNDSPNQPPIIPFDNNLWITKSTDAIGGGSENSSKIKYSIPNLVFEKADYQNPSEPIFRYKMPASNNQVPRNTGLYNVEEFSSFLNLLGSPTGVIAAQTVDRALLNVKNPTKYETVNYLIPTTADVNRLALSGNQIDTLGLATHGDGKQKIYAPLYGEHLLYENPTTIIDSVKQYLIKQTPSLNVYVENLFDVSIKMRKLEPQVNSDLGIDIYKRAADYFYDSEENNNTKLSCASMAGQFLYYFLGNLSGMTNTAGCGKPLPSSLEDLYGQNPIAGVGIDPNIYSLELFYRTEHLSLDKYFTAYTPGPLTGGTTDNSNLATIYNPFTNVTLNSMRNFYSTKLVSLQSVLPAGEQSYANQQSVPLMSEGLLNDVTNQNDFNNYLKLEEFTDIPTQEIFQ